MMRLLSLVFICSFSVIMFAQNPDAVQILDRVKKNYTKVQDYSVKVKIKIDVEFLKVPETEAELLFQAPDKVKINSEGFAMLPKQGLNFTPNTILKAEHAAFFERFESYENHQCYVIKVVPMGNENDILLATLWIDKETESIRKVEATTRNSGTFTIMLQYDAAMLKKFPLPSALQFVFDINNAKIPKSFTGQQEDDRKPNRRGKLTKGTVQIVYSDYKVNTGKINLGNAK